MILIYGNCSIRSSNWSENLNKIERNYIHTFFFFFFFFFERVASKSASNASSSNSAGGFSGVSTAAIIYFFLSLALLSFFSFSNKLKGRLFCRCFKSIAVDYFSGRMAKFSIGIPDPLDWDFLPMEISSKSS